MYTSSSSAYVPLSNFAHTDIMHIRVTFRRVSKFCAHFFPSNSVLTSYCDAMPSTRIGLSAHSITSAFKLHLNLETSGSSSIIAYRIIPLRPIVLRVQKHVLPKEVTERKVNLYVVCHLWRFKDSYKNIVIRNTVIVKYNFNTEKQFPRYRLKL